MYQRICSFFYFFPSTLKILSSCRGGPSHMLRTTRLKYQTIYKIHAWFQQATTKNASLRLNTNNWKFSFAINLIHLTDNPSVNLLKLPFKYIVFFNILLTLGSGDLKSLSFKTLLCRWSMSCFKTSKSCVPDLKIRVKPQRNEGDPRTVNPLLLCTCSRCTAKDLWTRLAPGGVWCWAQLSWPAPILSKPLKDLWRPVWHTLREDLANSSKPWGLLFLSICMNTRLKWWQGSEIHEVSYCFGVQDMLCCIICMHQAVT